MKATSKSTKAAPGERPVIVCTELRGVFFGYATETKGETVTLSRARMAIYFCTTRGVLELAETGPTAKSKISARAPSLELRKISAVIEVAPAAVEAWESAK